MYPYSYFRMFYNKVRPLHARVEEITNEINDLERKIEQLKSKYSVNGNLYLHL